jgi:sec-independent protein translocase protein TatC
MLGFCFSLPITSYNLAKFFSPALYPNEKKLIVKISLSIIPLFLVGCLFAYFLFIPLTIKLLYYYIFSLEIVPFIDLNFFINFILLFTVIMGIVFLTPVIMYGLSKLGIISKESWKGYFRWVFLGSIIVGAIITPDGSGITQLLFAGTFMGLYLLGILIIKLKV